MKRRLLYALRWLVWTPFFYLDFMDLARWRWFRRAWGGHWERWYVEPCHSDIWHEDCRHGERPNPVCRGTPTCEDYPEGA